MINRRQSLGDMLGLVRSHRIISRSGEVGSYSNQVHGADCLFISDNGTEVDVDFAAVAREGFGIWRLRCYGRSWPEPHGHTGCGQGFSMRPRVGWWLRTFGGRVCEESGDLVPDETVESPSPLPNTSTIPGGGAAARQCGLVVRGQSLRSLKKRLRAQLTRRQKRPSSKNLLKGPSVRPRGGDTPGRGDVRSGTEEKRCASHAGNGSRDQRGSVPASGSPGRGTPLRDGTSRAGKGLRVRRDSTAPAGEGRTDRAWP
ncbi:DUF6896 domain-containing protein [Streptomyces flaveolus]|uniref:DUF6896 domain-containing protein n=1 Tax=Streptomyces flaveolus TaxID=67297 RepID=UPI003F54FB1D